MTALAQRRIPFDLDGVPFQWQPANPRFGLFGNAFSFIAVAFERYLITVVREALPLVRDEDAASDADGFLRQEGLHATAHRRHVAALVAQHPGLRQALDGAQAAYDDLLARAPLATHLAYVANLEATFTPLFTLVLDNRRALFGGGDPRVAALLAWHFVEEVEHRSSGLLLCRHFVPDGKRVRLFPATVAHVRGAVDGIMRCFDAEVPRSERLVDGRFLTQPHRRWGGRRMLAGVPAGDLARTGWRLARSQAPRHDPAVQPLPAWADQWLAGYAAGEDMTAYPVSG